MFTLPPILSLLAKPGRHQPCLFGCRVDVDPKGEVTIQGRDRVTIIRQASQFLGPLVRNCPALSIPATLFTPARHGANLTDSRGGADGYQILVRAQVAIVPAVVPAVVFC